MGVRSANPTYVREEAPASPVYTIQTNIATPAFTRQSLDSSAHLVDLALVMRGLVTSGRTTLYVDDK